MLLLLIIEIDNANMQQTICLGLNNQKIGDHYKIIFESMEIDALCYEQ